MNDVFKDIKGYEGIAKISRNGTVYFLPRSWEVGGGGVVKSLERKTKGSKSNGYFVVNLNKDKKNKSFRVHRLVASAFIPNPENKPFVNHKNGIKIDNRIENLEWCTPKENTSHAVNAGLFSSKGEKNGRCILTAKKGSQNTKA